MANLSDIVAPKPRGILSDFATGMNRESVSGLLGAPVDMATMLANLLIAGGGYVGHKAGILSTPPELIDNSRAVGSSDWIYNRLPNQPALSGSKAETAGRIAGALMSPPVAMKTAPVLTKAMAKALQEKAPQMIDDYVRAIGGRHDAIVYHGSPHKFDAFDMSKIGTGEGAQAYGHGIYLAESPDVARSYRKAGIDNFEPMYVSTARNVALDPLYGSTLEEKVSSLLKHNDKKAADYLRANYQTLLGQQGNLYTVDLPDSAIARMLDWDKPLSQQQQIISILDRSPFTRGLPAELTGEQVYRNLGAFNRAGASEVLKNKGIPGIRYLDGASRGAGAGTSNFVVFDDKLPKILRRE